MKNKSLLLTVAIMIIAMCSNAQEKGTFTDSRDKKTYKTVVIGKQTWMAENLAYKANSGCWAYDNDQNNMATYGYLYTWDAAKSVCPSGWHLPSDAEWTQLIDYLGGKEMAGKMKEAGTTHWTSPNTGADNSSGFGALPGGLRNDDEAFLYVGDGSYMWSSTGKDAYEAFYWSLYAGSFVGGNFGSNSFGFSVRCLKDL